MSSNNRRPIFGAVFVSVLVLAVAVVSWLRGPVQALDVEPAKVLGDPRASVTITEFSDFECPYCEKIQPLLKEMVARYPGKVKLVFKHFPLESHRNSIRAAVASECAAEQNKFWEFSEILFTNLAWFDSEPKKITDAFKVYADQTNLDWPVFQRCYESVEPKKRVALNRREGLNYLISGTPTCLLNEKRILTRPRNRDYLVGEIEKEIRLEEGAAR